VDKSLGEWGDKVPAGDRDELVKTTDELKELLRDQAATAGSLNAASEKVMGIFSRIGQSMYQQAAAEPTAAAAGGGEAGAEGPASSGEDEVVEGEIVEEGGSS
jgi:molecular chaperone DnaK